MKKTKKIEDVLAVIAVTLFLTLVLAFTFWLAWEVGQQINLCVCAQSGIGYSEVTGPISSSACEQLLCF
jgi:hypothetical protein